MSTLLVTTNKPEGVEKIYSDYVRFLETHGLRMMFEVDRLGLKTAIGEIWDSLGDLDYSADVTGSLKTAIPQNFVHLIACFAVSEQFKQFQETLPAREPPSLRPRGIIME